MCKFIAERIITCQCTNENLGNSLTKRDFRLQSGNLVYKMRFSFTKRDSWVTNGTLALHFTLAPMKAVKKLLVSMELHLDASIDKLDNLAMNVQFDKEKRMEQTKDKEQKAPDTEREIIYSPMVAEPQEYKYNADAFAARKTSEAKQETAGKELPKVREDKAR